MESYKFRAGYAYSTDPIKPNVGGSLAGFPLGQSTVQLIQAAAVPLVYKDRLTLGVGKQGVMVPNLNVDLFGGLLFQGTGSFGPHTTASLAMYYFGRGFHLEVRRLLAAALRPWRWREARWRRDSGV